MSFPAIAWAAGQKLPCHEKMVLIMLSDMADMDGRCFPTVQKLADKCGLSISQTRKCLAKLEKARFLIREARIRTYGNTSNMIYLEVGYTPTPIECPPTLMECHNL